MKLKVCGMKHNIPAVAACEPDYLGFIYYEKSPRNFAGEIPKIASSIKKVGVFVDAPIGEVVEKSVQYEFRAIQLHGNESPSYCNRLRKELHQPDIELWKVFSVGDTFDFDALQPYLEFTDKFLFDTSGPAKGGNGFTFNWNILQDYPYTTPFILSGGIGLEELSAVKKIQASNIPLFAIDVNSKLETSPGNKNIKQLKQLIAEL